jgi:hypothetical protein
MSLELRVFAGELAATFLTQVIQGRRAWAKVLRHQRLSLGEAPLDALDP